MISRKRCLTAEAAYLLLEPTSWLLLNKFLCKAFAKKKKGWRTDGNLFINKRKAMEWLQMTNVR